MAPLSQLLVLPLVMLLVGGVLSKPAPLRVQVADEEAAELGDDQAEDGDDATAEADSTGVRPVAILEHRQELQDDGTFNYAFSADNGLTQNEAFHPDGSRTGSYSYVDPKGETILVKYRADRFGFHVLDGSSIPSTPPQHVAPAPRAPQQAASSDYEREGFDHDFSFGGSRGGSSLKGDSMVGKKSVSSPIQGMYYGRSKGSKVDALPGTEYKPKAIGLYSVLPGVAARRAQDQAQARAAQAKAHSSASSASKSLHFLQREARQAFVSDMDSDAEETRIAVRTARPLPDAPYAAPYSSQQPQQVVMAAASNDVSGAGHGREAPEDANYDHHALKYDDGSYEPHAVKYDDGSYEPHAAKYDDGSYEPHAAKYDDGSYEHHAAKYDDGSYEPHAAKYDDGSYERHAARYNDGRYRVAPLPPAEHDAEAAEEEGHGDHP